MRLKLTGISSPRWLRRRQHLAVDRVDRQPGTAPGAPVSSGVVTFRCCVTKNAATVAIASATNAATGSASQWYHRHVGDVERRGRRRGPRGSAAHSITRIAAAVADGQRGQLARWRGSRSAPRSRAAAARAATRRRESARSPARSPLRVQLGLGALDLARTCSPPSDRGCASRRRGSRTRLQPQGGADDLGRLAARG